MTEPEHVIELRNVAQVVRRLRRGRARRLRDPRGRVLRDARPVGLRQDDDAQDDRRLRTADEWRGHPQRRRREPGAAAQAQREHRVPAVRALPAHDGGRQRPVRPEVEEEVEIGVRGERHRDARRGATRRLRAPQAEPALGRPAAARRARPCTRQLSERAAARRAPRRARPQAARSDAVRAQAHPARRRDHVRVRHPRSGRGADDERPDRRHERRSSRTDRLAGGDLQQPGESVRRRFHRVGEHAARRGRRPATATTPWSNSKAARPCVHVRRTRIRSVHPCR